MLESKQEQEREGLSSNFRHIIIGTLPTIFLPVLAISLILFVGGMGAFQPSFIFAQSANVGDPAAAASPPSNISATTTITLPVAPITIGNQFYQERGMVTTQRVLDLNGPVFENTYVANGMLRGTTIPVINIGTIHVTFRPGGTVFGEGKGVITNSNGEMVTWTSHGLGHVSQGKTTVIGSVILNTSSTGSLSFLNNMVGVFRQVIDPSTNNVVSKVWELR
jgi:hypothetical protein